MPCKWRHLVLRRSHEIFLLPRILILASAVFFYGSGQSGNVQPASLFDAHSLIRDLVGKRRPCFLSSSAVLMNNLRTAAALLFALALLSSGQSSSIIATVAGQAVSEGFLQWKVSVRRPSTTTDLNVYPTVSPSFAGS
jgi:metal iron transporter